MRSAIDADAAFLIEMARYACVIDDWPLPAVDDEDVQDLRPSCGAISVLAVDASSVRMGAVWTFDHDPPLLIGRGGVAVPEIAMAVDPAHRGRGVGGVLLDELFSRSAGKYERLSLNVHQRNPAQHLYRRKGFRAIGPGRGALGIAMVKELPHAEAVWA